MEDLIEILEDGTVVRTKPVNFWMRQKPTYGAWLNFLLSRDAARKFTEGWKVTRDGKQVPVVKIETLSEQIARIDDETGYPYVKCLRCGVPVSVSNLVEQKRFTGGKTGRAGIRFVKDLGRICVGGFVRMPMEERVNHNEVLRKTVLRPVSKLGAGCPACQGLYATELAKTAEENRKRDRLGKAMLDLWKIEEACGMKPKPIKVPQHLTAWIDVFADHGRRRSK